MSNNDCSANKKIRVLLVSPLPSSTSFGGIGIWTARFVETLKQKQNVEIRIVNSIPVDNNGKDIARSKNIFKKFNCNIRILKNIKRKIMNIDEISVTIPINLLRKKKLTIAQLPFGTQNDVAHMYGLTNNILHNLE